MITCPRCGKLDFHNILEETFYSTFQCASCNFSTTYVGVGVKH